MAPLVVAAVAAVLVAGWSVAAVLMSTRGFDITDEGYYVLAYRDWDTNLRTFTGSQYVYGPVFDLVGQSVPALRLVRLATVLGAHAAFAWAFMGWVRSLPQGFGLSRSWTWAGGLSIVASGGVVYGWLPLSPGYNDVSILGTLVLMAAVLRVVRWCDRTGRVPQLPLVAMGPVVVVILLAKSVAGLPSVAFLLGLTAVLCAVGRARGFVAAAAAFVVSVGVALVVVDLWVMPFARMLPPIREVNSLVAAGTNSPARLVQLYVSGVAQLFADSLVLLALPVVLVAVGLVLLRAQLRRAGLTLLAGAGPAGLLLRYPGTVGLPPAGADTVPGYAAALTSVVLLAAAVLTGSALAGRSRPREPRGAGGRRRVLVVLALAALPAVQALGTGNELYVMAVNQIACWVALLVLGVVWVRGRPAVLVPVVSTTVVCVVVAAATGVGGLLQHPYRADPFLRATATVGGTGVLAGLKVSPERAEDFKRLLSASGPGSRDRVVMAFDEMPGLVLLLDGATAGEAWYSASDRPRTAAGIRASCTSLGDREVPPPVALFNRAPATTDIAALRDCGIVLTDDPTPVRLVGQPDVLVYSTTRP